MQQEEFFDVVEHVDRVDDEKFFHTTTPKTTLQHNCQLRQHGQHGHFYIGLVPLHSG